MGEILLARAEGAHGFRRRVVLKGLLPELAQDLVSLDLFRREAMIMSRLDHPNIVRVIDFVDVDDQPFIAMEYVRGRNFHQLIQRATAEGLRVPLEVGLAVVGGALRGLHHAHQAVDFDGRPLNVVHRDVSPSNVLLSYFGEVKVTDFGIAIADGERRHTAKSNIRGKARYVAPELVIGQGATPRSDVFAAGVVLAEALTGAALFDRQGLNATLLAIVREDRRELMDRIFSGLEEVPGLRGVLQCALAKRPEDRFASALQMAEAIAGVERACGGGMPSHELGAYLRDLFREASDLPKEHAPPSRGSSVELFEPRTLIAAPAEGPAEDHRRRPSRPPPRAPSRAHRRSSAPPPAISREEISPPAPPTAAVAPTEIDFDEETILEGTRASSRFDIDAFLVEAHSKVSRAEPLVAREAAFEEPLVRRPTEPAVEHEPPLVDPTRSFERSLKIVGAGLVGLILSLSVIALALEISGNLDRSEQLERGAAESVEARRAAIAPVVVIRRIGPEAEVPTVTSTEATASVERELSAECCDHVDP